MSYPTDIAQFKALINTFVNNNWVVAGGFAIDIWCTMSGVQLPDVLPNNIDIVYAKMTPIVCETVGNYKRIQTTPHTSVTYNNPGFTPINLTMTRNNIKYYEFEGLKIMSPSSLLSWYEEEPELYQEKISQLRDIISRTTHLEFNYIYSKNIPSINSLNESPAKRMMF